MYRIIICDDNKTTIEEVKKKLMETLENIGKVDYEIEDFCCGKKLLESEVKGHIYFLDVEMPEMDGLCLGKIIRKRDSRAVIIFLTRYPDYAAEGYHVNAHRYLVKPMEEKKLYEALSTALKKAKPQEIVITDTSGGIQVVDLRCVKYIKSAENYVCFYMEENKRLLVRGTLKYWEDNLPKPFMLIKRGCVLNLHFEESINYSNNTIRLSTGEELEFATRKKKELKKAIEENFIANCGRS